jgi:hypothetical protein
MTNKDAISPINLEIGGVGSGFSEGGRLCIDYVNAYATMGYWGGPYFPFEKVKPLPTYKEFFQRYSPSYLSTVLKLSNPEAMDELDRLVEAFNADLERIKKEKDTGACKKFFETMQALIHSKK